MNSGELENFLKTIGEPKFRSQQILQAIYREGVASIGEISNIPKDLKERLEGEFKILSFDVVKVLEASDKKTAKALLKMADGSLIETVLIVPKPGFWSVCLSCQVGCPMGCRFCATGEMGFKRNLSAEEIADQVLFWKQYLKSKKPKSENVSAISNIVYMGMGEPFQNWDQVSGSLKILLDKKLFGLGARSISISTSGIVDGLEKIAAEFPQINLAISLHFADDRKRSQFMPVNQKSNLAVLRLALQKYLRSTRRQVFIEYILLDGINDARDDAMQLADYLKSIDQKGLLHVNLIRYNTTSDAFRPSSGTVAQKFKQALLGRGVSATIRKSLGEEIQGACGQLAGV